MQGAGGTPGGTGRFFLGLVMLVAGLYLFLSSIQVSNHFSLGYSLFTLGRFRVTSGLVLVPFVFGIGLVFFDARSIGGWLLVISSILLLIFGVIASLHFYLRPMAVLELLMILILMAGGSGLFLSSFRNYAK